MVYGEGNPDSSRPADTRRGLPLHDLFGRGILRESTGGVRRARPASAPGGVPHGRLAGGAGEGPGPREGTRRGIFLRAVPQSASRPGRSVPARPAAVLVRGQNGASPPLRRRSDRSARARGRPDRAGSVGPRLRRLPRELFGGSRIRHDAASGHDEPRRGLGDERAHRRRRLMSRGRTAGEGGRGGLFVLRRSHQYRHALRLRIRGGERRAPGRGRRREDDTEIARSSRRERRERWRSLAGCGIVGRAEVSFGSPGRGCQHHCWK
mmetsp:Transcript_33629/g.77609  ORF Transcript_33629/g.77609 Transcript_33629/m.77609 type:complete len:265 (+) Transcript_33629:371-1165(+)